MPEADLDAPVVLVTGAARRIGAAIAAHFHAQGFRVIVHYRHAETEATALVATLNTTRQDSAATLQADLTDSGQAEALAVRALDCFGRLDVLVNNASSFYPTPLGQATPADWEALMGSNLTGPFFLSQALAEELRARRGAIVNLVDTHADRPLAGFPVYSMAKAGLKAMTKALALELAPGVRVNGVSPGAILWPPRLEDDSDPQVLAAREKVLAAIPLQRLGTPQQIAAAVFFLARQASYVTGQVIAVDGGRRLA